MLCIKDSLCVDVCPTDCIHPKTDEAKFEAVTQLYVQPDGCIDCDACVPVCTSDAIHPIDDLTEEQQAVRRQERGILQLVRPSRAGCAGDHVTVRIRLRPICPAVDTGHGRHYRSWPPAS